MSPKDQRAHSGRRTAIAVIAAYALVLQAMLLAFAAGLHPVPAHGGGGAALAVMCNPTGSGVPDQPARHDAGSLCCIVGCAAHGAAAPAATLAGFGERSWERPLRASAPRSPNAPRRAALPVGARAPPVVS